MWMLVPLMALILFLRVNGSMPDVAHLNLKVAHAEYFLRGWWPSWQMQMRTWHPQEYALWGGFVLASLATAHTLARENSVKGRLPLR